MTWFRLKARRCQYCCNVIGRWAAFFGVLNCRDCVFRMQMGAAPRCTCSTGRCAHAHGQDIG